MIDIEELSRGNYVYSRPDGKCGEVIDIFTSKSGIDTVGLLIRKEKVYREPKDISEIEVNPDWLWYLGFHTHNEKDYFIPGENARERFEVSCFQGFTYSKFGTRFALRQENKLKTEYVHNLQNIYFLATMQKLKIKNFSKKPEKKIDNKPIDWDNEMYDVRKLG